MRSISIMAVALALAAAFSQATAQQQLAIPMDVRSLTRSPPTAGRLVRVSGHLEQVGQEVVLRDLDTGQKVDLDFTGSAVPVENLLRGAGPSPAEVTGRMKSTSNNGRPSVDVIGAIALNP